MENKILIDSVNNLKVALNEISVYDFDVYTSMELYYKIAENFNKVIKELNRFEDVVSDEVIKQNEKLLYLLGEGLKIEVVDKINEMVEKGVFDTIINHNIFNNLKNDINNLNLQLEHIAIDGSKMLSDIFQNNRGKVIKIPKGEYYLSSPIIVDGGGADSGISSVLNNISWIIEMEKGTIIHSPENDYAFIFQNRADKVQVKNGIIKGYNGIKLYECQSTMIEGCDINVTNECINIEGLGVHRISNNILKGRSCIHFESHGGDTVLTGNDYYPTSGVALKFSKSSGDIKSDNEIYTILNGSIGIQVLDSATEFNQLFLTNNAILVDYNSRAIEFNSSLAIKYTDINISDNAFWVDQTKARTLSVLYAKGLINSNISNNKFYGSTTTDGSDIVVELISSQNNIVSHNTFHDNSGSPIYLKSCTNNIVDGNMFRLNSSKGDGTASADIVLYNSTRNTIKNNYHEKNNALTNKTVVLELGTSDYNKIFAQWQSDNCINKLIGSNSKEMLNLNQATKTIDRLNTDYLFSKDLNTRNKLTFQALSGSFMEITASDSSLIFSIVGVGEILRLNNNGIDLYNNTKNIFMTNSVGQKVKLTINSNNELVITKV